MSKALTLTLATLLFSCSVRGFAAERPDVDGTWTLELRDQSLSRAASQRKAQPGRYLDIEQKGEAIHVRDLLTDKSSAGSISGDEITIPTRLQGGDVTLRGHIIGKSITGTFMNGKRVIKWSA